MEIKKIKQHDITDCGAACLASIAEHFKLKIPLARVRQYASTDKKGTNLFGLIEAATKLGFMAKGVKGPIESLSKIPLPAIAHVIIKKENAQLFHFVVIYQVTDKHIMIMDPGDGEVHKKTYEEFKEIWSGALLLIVPDDQFKTGNEKTSVSKRFFSLIKPHKLIMTQALIGAIVYSALGLSTSIYVQKIVDFVVVDGNKNLLNILSVVMVVLLVIRTYIGYIKSLFATKIGQKIDATLILGYYKHLMKLPQQFFDTMRVGEIISRVNDAVKIRTFINDVSLEFIVNIMITVFTLIFMIFNSWKLTLVFLVAIKIFASIYFIFNKMNKRYLRKTMEDSADLEAQLVESINAVSTIKRFGLEGFSNLKTEIRFVRLLSTVYDSSMAALFSGTASMFVSGGVTIAVLWVGATQVINREITPGELMAFYALVGYLLSPITSLITMNRTMQDAVIATDRLFQIMDLEREESEENKIILSKEMIGNIRFNNVSFRYGSRTQVFENFNLHIKIGRMTAIVGESGSGKTTLISLLQNIYPIQDGSISFGNYDLKHVGNQSLRELVSVVPQKIDLFAGTLIENIAVGDFEPDMKKIVDICQNLGITKFIENLPNGFYTLISEHGDSLSGGEKQRIAIARALYKSPEILILDEATSSLDSASEQYVQQTIQYLKEKNKTIIVIAHRLSTVMNADSIILLKEGKVEESGTHKELFDQKKEYYNLWVQQFPMLEEMK